MFKESKFMHTIFRSEEHACSASVLASTHSIQKVLTGTILAGSSFRRTGAMRRSDDVHRAAKLRAALTTPSEVVRRSGSARCSLRRDAWVPTVRDSRSPPCGFGGSSRCDAPCGDTKGRYGIQHAAHIIGRMSTFRYTHACEITTVVDRDLFFAQRRRICAQAPQVAIPACFATYFSDKDPEEEEEEASDPACDGGAGGLW
ncbi:hypothetical protein C8R45DRAFT_934186 [Mycena sanguinolenta]|nr:hypothetical protein C8R45DRAFT_934186 [Mycena sanguinolenta]